MFGEQTLNHAINIARGHVDFLPRLPRQVLVKIIGYLPLEDIPNLSYVSKQFQEVNTLDADFKVHFVDYTSFLLADRSYSIIGFGYCHRHIVRLSVCPCVCL